MSTELIKKIKDNYNINNPLKGIENVDRNSNTKIISFEKDYIVKNIDNIYCKNIDLLYNYLYSNNYVLLPIKTVNDKYSLSINGKTYLVYPRLQEIKGEIEPYWWALALESIHNTKINKNDFINECNIDKECFSLLNKAKELFSNDINQSINKLLDDYYCEKQINKMVLSLGNPGDKNVMNDNMQIKLIDTDKMRLLPEEYDIQRLFANKVIHEKNIDEIEKYINIFFYNYHNKIDMDLLKKIYVTDLIRMLSRLSLDTMDKTREEKEELIMLQESLLSEKHHKILKKL